MENLIKTIWIIATVFAFYALAMEFSIRTKKKKVFFLDTSRRRKFIVVSFIFLLIPFISSVYMHFTYNYPFFRFSHINGKGILEALSYIAFPLSSITLAIFSQFTETKACDLEDFKIFREKFLQKTDNNINVKSFDNFRALKEHIINVEYDDIDEITENDLDSFLTYRTLLENVLIDSGKKINDLNVYEVRNFFTNR